MYHVSAQGIDERMINVHYYYYMIIGDDWLCSKLRSFVKVEVDPPSLILILVIALKLYVDVKQQLRSLWT